MTQDVRQWLAEIKSLQQKLVEAHQERDEAYASASKWRSLYETEAKQRRTDASLARQTIDSLKLELDRLRGLPTTPDGAALNPAAQQEIAQLQSLEALQQRLIQAMTECNRLGQALKTEQAEHSKTRSSLTTALGDTVDMLTRQRSGEESFAAPNASTPDPNGAAPTAKTPSLELPTLD